MNPKRPDDPLAMEEHAYRFYCGKALVVLGGPSGKKWEALRNRIKPDVIITTNGATRLPGIDYWLLVENMNYCHNKATREGDKEIARYLQVLDKDNTAEFQFYSHRSLNLLPQYGIDPSDGNIISIRRKGYALNQIPEDYTLREYGEGFLAGGISRHKEAWQQKPRPVQVRVGTVGLQALHLAGILGCSEVHTIGFDLMYKDKNKHHWYEYPLYKADRFRTDKMFVEHKGIYTQLWWLEAAEYLAGLQYLFDRDDLVWRDHSDGLLKVEGVWCAN